MIRHLCRSEKSDLDKYKLGDASFGYTSGIAVAYAIKEFMDAHDHALHVMVRTTIALEGGVEHNLRNPRAVIVYLTPKRDRTDTNPATAFYVPCVETVHKDDKPVVRSTWAEHKAACDEEEARIRATNPGPTFAGTIPVAFVVGGTGHVSTVPYGISQPSIDDTALDERTTLGLEDLISLCTASISIGHSYYVPRGHSRPEPAVGQYVQSRKSWRRVPMKEPVWNVMDSYMRDRPSMFKSGMSIRELWNLYARL